MVKYRIITENKQDYKVAVVEGYGVYSKMWVLDDDVGVFNFHEFARKSPKNFLHYHEDSYEKIRMPTPKERGLMVKTYNEIKKAHEVIEQKKIEKGI